MNLFRFLGDLSHLLAIILLLLKIWKSRSCAGISGKSQVLFAVVFTARYLDLFTNYISLYNTCMKVECLVPSLILLNVCCYDFLFHDRPGWPDVLIFSTEAIIQEFSDPLDLLHLPGVGGHLAAAIHGEQDWRGGDHHQPLLVCAGRLPHAVSLQLDLALPFRGLLRPHRHRGRPGPDSPLLRFLLPL
uniref:KDEL endoplasmic reticulum protein retention receptor 1 n=1 Tax=Rhinopithecus roxellana TaxID=61622 RepID=A0A2K6NT04_RHIRO